MRIKKIILKNFRQFIDSEIEFSTDEQKNVTIIMGDNGDGKTTLAQAFRWVLYGETEFKVKEVINRKVRDEMEKGETVTVEVVLVVDQDQVLYTIKRMQDFKKNVSRVEGASADLHISYVDENGTTKFLDANNRRNFIGRMIPKELARFFFFDGEQIKGMSEELSNGKSSNFKAAVQGLTGQTAMQNAIKHLKPSRTKTTVLGIIESEIDDLSNDRLREYADKINNGYSLKEELENRIKEIEEQKEYFQQVKDENYAILVLETPKIELKEKYETLEKNMRAVTISKNREISKMMLPLVDEKIHGFFNTELARRILPGIKETEFIEKGIPELHKETILYILKRSECLCGCNLDVGTSAYNEVYKLFEHAYPESISTKVNSFIDVQENSLKMGKDFYERFVNAMKSVQEYNSELEKIQSELINMRNMLSDSKDGENAKVKMENAEREITRLNNELIQNQARLQNIETEISRNEKQKKEFEIIDEKNQTFYTSKRYASTIYETLDLEFYRKEAKIRVRLEEKINEIFKNIYGDGMKISIDPRYNIKVTVDEASITEDEIEKNTAQNYSIIFAFIAGIISIAKENALDEEEEIYMDDEEGYPLIMDAPLSAFDKTRIKSICENIPQIAEQVIMFIKDTDGEVAQQHMSAVIGKEYYLNKVNNSQIYSIVEER